LKISCGYIGSVFEKLASHFEIYLVNNRKLTDIYRELIWSNFENCSLGKKEEELEERKRHDRKTWPVTHTYKRAGFKSVKSSNC
jgi:hypothetical protein